MKNRPVTLRSCQTAERRALQRERRRLRAELRREEGLVALRQECDTLRHTLTALLDGVRVTAERIGPAPASRPTLDGYCHQGPPDYIPWDHAQDCPQA